MLELKNEVSGNVISRSKALVLKLNIRGGCAVDLNNVLATISTGGTRITAVKSSPS